MIFAKLNASGLLDNMRVGTQQPGGVWPDGSQDVPLAAMPTGSFDTQYTYDSVNQLAVPLSPAAQATYDTGQERTQAASLVSDPQAQLKVLRALMLVAMSEINLLRQRQRDQDAAVAAATSLADLKSRWATVASSDPMPDRIASQLRTAITNNINSGAADN